MQTKASRGGRTAATLAGILLVAALGFGVGVAITTGNLSPTPTQLGAPESSPPIAADQVSGYSYGRALGGGGEDAAKEVAVSDGTNAMLIKTAGLEIRVDDVDAAVAKVRTTASKHGADITDLQVQSGVDPGPVPLAEKDASAERSGPASAFITLRVPADRLDALRAEISKTGTVISQSDSSSDVGQEHADLSARLKNLRAQEARLRRFFDEATKVSDLLAVEEQLSRVRGEIESLQAQVDYLERQVARATLTVSLTEPGPIVQPAEGDWGFLDAIRNGVQAAAALIGLLITSVIAVAPLVVVGLLIWLAARAIVRRRRRANPVDVPDEHNE